MSDPIVRLAAVGLGGWGRNVVSTFASTEGCELACICDASESTLAAQSERFPLARAASSYESVLEDESIQAVSLATPAPAHFEMARAALRAGKHVFVEKPMTLRSAESAELLTLAAQADRRLMVGHLLLHHPAVRRMKRELESGTLGELHYLTFRRTNLGVIRTAENAFWSLAPHDISVALYLMDSEPERALAAGGCYVQPGVEDTVFVTLQFPGGRVANIHVSWLDPHKERAISAIGSKAMLVFDDMEPQEKLRLHQKRAETARGRPAVHSEGVTSLEIDSAPPLGLECEHFIACVRTGRTPLTDGLNGLKVVKVLEMVDQALRAHPYPAEGRN